MAGFSTDRPRVTAHAIERYRIHHPAARAADVWAAMDQGAPQDPDLIQALTSRSTCCRGSRYIAAPDWQGVFVLDANGRAVITYLRFNAAQQRVLQDPRLSLGEVMAESERTRLRAEKQAAWAAAKAKARDRAYLEELEARYGFQAQEDRLQVAAK